MTEPDDGVSARGVFPDPPLRLRWHPGAGRDVDGAFMERMQEWAWFASKLRALGRYPPTPKVMRAIETDLGLAHLRSGAEHFLSTVVHPAASADGVGKGVTVYFVLARPSSVWVLHIRPAIITGRLMDPLTLALVARRLRDVKGHLQDEESRR